MKYTEDGVDYEFNHERFHSSFTTRYTKRKGKQTQEQLRAEISEKVNVSPDTVKNWLRNRKGQNSPGDVNIVHKLEQFFAVESGYFLKEVHMEEVYIKNRLGIPDSEMSAAKEVYCEILDCIHAHMIPWCDWHGWPDMGSLDFHPMRGLSKDRFNLILKIRKSAMNLPERVRLASIDLVNEIYGPEDTLEFAFFETPDFYTYMDENNQGWREELEKEKSRDCDFDKFANVTYMQGMVEYNEYMTEKFYRRLDEIFADYIRH